MINLDRGQVFLQTKRYAQFYIREVNTRDSTSSLGFATDRRLDMPVIHPFFSTWEPADSAHCPGKLYLDKVVDGYPSWQEFLTEEATWPCHLRMVWGKIQGHYPSQLFGGDLGGERIRQWEAFFGGYPWGGLKDLDPGLLPPFQEPSAQPAAWTSEAPMAVRHLLDRVGEDGQGRQRLFFEDGKDTLKYARLMSRVAYQSEADGKKRYLDGTEHKPKKKKRKGIVRPIRVSSSSSSSSSPTTTTTTTTTTTPPPPLPPPPLLLLLLLLLPPLLPPSPLLLWWPSVS